MSLSPYSLRYWVSWFNCKFIFHIYIYIFLASINFFHSYLYFISFQDKQFLEPYGKPRDIAYIVLAPDNDYIINAIILFFKELSNVYELSRMGRHSPVSLKLRDGIMRVGKKIAEKFSTEDHPDDWFKFIGKLLYIHSCLVWIWCAELFTGKKPNSWTNLMIIVLGNSNVASKLRLYSQVCRSFLGKLDLFLHKYFAHSFMCKFKLWSLSDVHLTVWCQVNKKYYFSAPLLAQQNLDQSVFEPMSNNRPGYKPAETKPDVNQSEHNAFTMPAPQPHTAEDKGRNRLK